MRAGRISLIALAAFAVPSFASAHLVASGMGSLYDGIIHFGLSPEDFLPVIVLGFFAGLRGAQATRRLLMTLTLAWLIGGGLALAGLAIAPVVTSVATAILFLAIGGLLAANLALPERAGMALAAALGLVRGAADLAGVSGVVHLIDLMGMAASVFVVFAIAASITLPLTRLWMVIAVRVSGSWLAATGLLLAGWILRYGARAAG